MSAKKASDANIDDFLDEAMSTAVQHFGVEKCYVAAEHKKSLTVIPIPPLCLQWLIEANGWPLGRVTQSGGPFGTHKSTFIFQLIQWYLDAGGIAALIDTENKTSFSLLKSMLSPKYLNKEDPAHKRFMMYMASTVNQWQQMISKQTELVTAWKEKNKQVFKWPFMVAVDSMLGATSDEGLEKIRAEGEAAGRGYSDSPILISQFMRSMPDTLLGTPLTLHMSHHEKPNIGSPGMTRAGGKAPDFYATLDIQFKRGGVTAMGAAREFDRTDKQAKSITLSVRKSSMGSDIGKELSVSFCWNFSGPDGEQVSWWDWDSATAMLLAKESRALKDILDINSTQKQIVGEVFWSDALGIPAKDPLSAKDFAKLVESNTEMMPKIRQALHIRQYPVFGADNE